MMPWENVAAFVVASVVIILIPGPSVLFVIGRSIALGRRAGVLSVIGNALGTVPAVVAVAFGVGAIVASSVVAFTVLKVVGALYLVYLGVQAIRHRNDGVERTSTSSGGTARLLRHSAWALAAGTARAWFATSPRRMATLSGTGGVMMIGLGGTLALTGSKT